MRRSIWKIRSFGRTLANAYRGETVLVWRVWCCVYKVWPFEPTPAKACWALAIFVWRVWFHIHNIQQFGKAYIANTQRVEIILNPELLEVYFFSEARGCSEHSFVRLAYCHNIFLVSDYKLWLVFVRCSYMFWLDLLVHCSYRFWLAWPFGVLFIPVLISLTVWCTIRTCFG